MLGRGLSLLTVKTVEATPEPQLKIAFEMPHEPLLELRVKPEPTSR